MGEFNAQTQSHLDMVLVEVCNALPGGGDQEARKYVAERLVDAARSGRTTRDDLHPVALRALVELRDGKSARSSLESDGGDQNRVTPPGF